MDLTPTNRQLLYAVKLKGTIDAIDFDAVNWKATSGFHNRFVGHTSCDSQITHLIERISVQQHSLLETLWCDDYFKHDLWAGTSLEQLKQHTRPFVELCKDMPRFTTSIHVDHRRAVTTGMIFFNRDNLLEQNTVFYTSEQGAKPMNMSSAWCEGWYTANTHLSWHQGTNASNITRYSIKFGLSLSMPSGQVC